jgi:hypothetical protein
MSDQKEGGHSGWRRYLQILLAVQDSAAYAVSNQPVLITCLLLILVLQVSHHFLIPFLSMHLFQLMS